MTSITAQPPAATAGMAVSPEARFPKSPGLTPKPSSSSPWYALVVRSTWAFKIRDRLRELEIEEFLPTYTETIRWSDREKVSTRQLFPGYLFARFDSDDLEAQVLNLPGVVQALPSNLKPIPIPDAEITSLKIALESKLPVVCCPHVAGTPVTITAGALSGVAGVIERTKSATRVVVRIEMLNRSVAVEVEAADVEERKP